MSERRSSAGDSASLNGAELTGAAILLGLILSVVMGVANVYLGLRAE